MTKALLPQAMHGDSIASGVHERFEVHTHGRLRGGCSDVDSGAKTFPCREDF